MTCFHPLTAWYGDFNCATGKRSVTFDHRKAVLPDSISLPCGQCVGCRLAKSRSWAMRCINEASLHEQSCFVTLTYDDSNLPSDGSLVLSDLQKFFKRLRKCVGEGVRYYACGEYGDLSNRPHYHAIIFGWRPDDGILLKGKAPNQIYYSGQLASLWPFGISSFGGVTFDSCAYTARYVMKKLTGKREVEYQGKTPEFCVMSRRPGIGREWFKRYGKEVMLNDNIPVFGKKLTLRPPRYYDSLFEQNGGDLDSLKVKRKSALLQSIERDPDNFTPRRLLHREKACSGALISKNNRSI